MYWANFLHVYQPPGQTHSILERIVTESYEKIITGLFNHPKVKLTLNINAGLTETLAESRHQEIIEKIRKLLERGQIELTGTAKYHPLLPKMPPSEIERQIQINEITNREYFGPAYQPKGFFPPEMAYNAKVGKIVQKLDFQWIILDETAIKQPIDYSKTYQNSSGLGFFFRERQTSFKILSAQLGTANLFLKNLGERLEKNDYLLTAMDGETFGHHRPGLEQLLWDIGEKPKLPTVRISDLLKLYPENIMVEPQPTSWAMVDPILAEKIPFIRWDDPDNEIQQKQWEFAGLAITAVEKDGRPKSRNLLDKALYSDQFWWASARPWWSLEMIEKGAHSLLKAVQSCDNIEERIKQQAKELYLGIIITSFDWQRSGKVEKMSRKEDEEIKTRTTISSSSLSEKDYLEMIKNLTLQMLTSAKSQEYTRAQQIKERIKEIKERKLDTKVNQ